MIEGILARVSSQVKLGTLATEAAFVARALLPAATKDGIAREETSEA